MTRKRQTLLEEQHFFERLYRRSPWAAIVILIVGLLLLLLLRLAPPAVRDLLCGDWLLRPMPGERLPGQRGPPCPPHSETLADSCWVLIRDADGAPINDCGSSYYNRPGGGCVTPLWAKQAPPNALDCHLSFTLTGDSP